MQNKPCFYPLWALFVFWSWALHVATDFLHSFIRASSGRRSAIVGMLDSITEGALVSPLGRPLTVIMLVAVGLGLAFWMHQRRRKPEVATDTHKAWLSEINAIESEALRSYLFSRMKDQDTSDIYNRDDVTDEEYQSHQEAMASMVKRNDLAFKTAFSDDPISLTMALYARLPARKKLPKSTVAHRSVNAGFDSALEYGWLLILTTQNPLLGRYRSTDWDWKGVADHHKEPLKLSEAQLSEAMRTVSKLISMGFNDTAYKSDNWYVHIVRAAVADQWPKHRNDLISMFSAGFQGRSNAHNNVMKMTEALIEETPLKREDIPELVEFDRVSAKLDTVRALVFAELGEPLASAMEEVLNSGGGFLERKRYPALCSLRKLSPKQRGDCFAQLVATIAGLDRHGLDYWEKLKREKSRYQLGLNHDSEYSVLPEMSFLFVELTRKEMLIPDRDRTISAFLDLLPYLIYLQDELTLNLVLETAKQEPHGLTAKKLRVPLPKPTHHPFLPQFKAQIGDTVRSLA